MRRWTRLAASALAVALAAGEGAAARDETPLAALGTRAAAAPAAPARIGDLLSMSGEGFALVEGPRTFVFPADHGPHPDYRSEWWYFTGNVSDAQGSHYGFQLTFFRFRLAAEPAERRSAWAANQAYMAHFAVTDVTARRFHAFERFSRGALGLAGAQALPFRVWLEDWSASATGGAGAFAVRLQAGAEGVGIDLAFGPGPGPILHGDEGYSRKSAIPGYASYYYSYPRMPVSGRLRTPRGEFAVAGAGWLDREWSSSALAPDQVGWDWFSLRLSDGSALMLYRLRRRDGSADPFSYGVLVESGGGARPLARGDLILEITNHWQPFDKIATYPSGWRLLIPSRSLEIEITPLLEDQEWRGAFRYWEGAVSARGRAGSIPVSGSGYVELTGYAEPVPSEHG